MEQDKFIERKFSVESFYSDGMSRCHFYEKQDGKTAQFPVGSVDGWLKDNPEVYIAMEWTIPL